VRRAFPHRVAAVICAALALTGSIALAQNQRSRPFAADPFTMNADLVEAMRLVNTNPEAAVALLHKLNARNPRRDEILTRLAYALQVSEKTDSATYYYRQALDVNPLNLEAGKALGSIYFAEGREQDALQVFDRLLDANNHSLAAYKMVAGAIRDLGRADEAVTMLEKGRSRMRATDRKNRSVGAFTLEIAAAYKQMGESRRAMDEYLDYATQEPRNFRYVRDKMVGILSDDEKNRDTLAQYMKSRVERGGGGAVAAADVLAAYYLQQGALENSLDMALRADADKNADGSSLLSIGEDAIERAGNRPRAERGRYYDLALRSLEAYTQRHPRSPSMDKAHYLLAGVYVSYGSGYNPAVPATEWTQYLERGVDEYAAVSKEYAGTDYAQQAYIDRGDVLLRKLKRPKDALDAYKSGAVNARRNGEVYAGRIASVYIATRPAAETEHYLRALLKSDRPELAQAGQYYAGVYLTTQHKYEAARDTLTSLAERAPFSSFTNDAIDMAWVLQEGLQLGSRSLDDYSATLSADMVGDTTAVLSHLRRITGRTIDEPLRPRALRQLGGVLFEVGNYDESIATLRRFLDEYPEDDACPAVQREIGRTYEMGLGRYADALEQYEHVLVAYPDYAMMDDVRRDVNRVRAYTEGATYAP